MKKKQKNTDSLTDEVWVIYPGEAPIQAICVSPERAEALKAAGFVDAEPVTAKLPNRVVTEDELAEALGS